MSIIEVRNNEHISTTILLNLTHLNVCATELLFEGADVVLEGVLFDHVLLVILLSQRDGRLGVVGDDAIYDWMVSLDILGAS